MSYLIRKLDIKTRQHGLEEFKKIGASVAGQNIMINKIFPLCLKVKGIDTRAANILKQEMLSRMGDVVTSRQSLTQTDGQTDVIILGTEKAVRSLIDKIKMQPFGLKKLSEDLEHYLENLRFSQARKILKIGGKNFDLVNEGALIMGILNVTPDSFYDGGYYYTEKDINKRVREIVEEGAHIIDVGGMSTRPGSKPVEQDEEISRILPAIRHIKDNYDIAVSVDTYRSEVAQSAVDSGADMINDISGLTFDKKMIEVVASYGTSVVIMHIKGTPENMQQNPYYDDVTDEIYSFLLKQASMATDAGIDKENIIIDPGIGFGKKIEHNIEIISKLSDFKNMGYPVMIGTSRKSFIGQLLGGLPPEERLYGSIASAACVFLNGADILRVHDVRQTSDAMKIVKSIKTV